MQGSALLQHWLALFALVAGTLQYAMLLRRRVASRAWDTQVAAAQESGVRGLVRVLLADDPDSRS